MTKNQSSSLESLGLESLESNVINLQFYLNIAIIECVIYLSVRNAIP